MSLIIKKNTTFKIPRDPIIWKIAIFGAGTTTSNGEYVWDGITTENGLPVYRFSFEVIDIIFGIDNYWHIYSSPNDTNYYKSLDLITWTIENGEPEEPSSALSYSPNSFISSVTLVDAGAINSNGTFSRTSGGSTQFDKAGSPNFIFDDGYWVVADYSAGTDTYTSSNYIFNWSANQVQFEPPPTVSSITYSA